MTETQKQKLKKIFIEQCPKAFRWHHYDLANNTSVHDPILWKEFLMLPDIKDWIESELNILNTAELNKALQDISKSNSTGTAYIINALQKVTEREHKQKSGPIFIYSYIPLNNQQEQAENVIKLENDPFLK